MSDGAVHICEACPEIIDPDEPGVVRAVEQVDVTASGTGPEAIDGPGVYFHIDCYSAGDPRYRLDS